MTSRAWGRSEELGVSPGRTIRFTFSGQNFRGRRRTSVPTTAPSPRRASNNLDEVAAGPIRASRPFPHQRQLMQKVLDELGEG